jgi:3-oxoacyl-[acyl-carrier-protein] synthase II
MYISKFNYILPELRAEKGYLNMNKITVQEHLEKNEIRRFDRLIVNAMGCALNIAFGESNLAGIITGTGRGCISKLEQFLADMNTYSESALNPSVFIQSTNNIIGGLIAQKLQLTTYNTTFVNQGLTVLNVLTDVEMKTLEDSSKKILFGFFDENTHFNQLIHSQSSFLQSQDGNPIIYGEGISFFIASQSPKNAIAKIESFEYFPTNQYICAPFEVGVYLDINNIEHPCVFYVGYNNEYEKERYYLNIVRFATKMNIPLIAYKERTGDFDTSAGVAIALALEQMAQENLKNIYIFNHYKKQSPMAIKLVKS